MASTSASRPTASAPAVHTVLPDEIWEQIFLRLDAAADLARASAACSSFRCVVSARRFLRRFRSLHSPPVLGFIGCGCREFLPVGPPHRSSPEAHALVQAGDFTFSFLPDPHSWLPRDTRDGRVLFFRSTSPNIQLEEDFLVCDPLHRRCVKIPRIPDDLLAASIPDDVMLPLVLPVLAPAAENDGEESFRVIITVQLDDQVVAFVFSSCSQTWRRIISTIRLPNRYVGYIPCYAYGCFYWKFSDMGYSLMLDTSEMEFSIIGLPAYNFDSVRVCGIVEAADGRLGFLTIGDGTVDLYCKNRQSNGVGGQEWQHEKLIPLPKNYVTNYSWHIKGTSGRYVALCVTCYDTRFDYFVLDMKTLLFEKLCSSSNGVSYGFPYARFPPLLALPSI